MSASSYWWRWLMVIVLPLLLWNSRQKSEVRENVIVPLVTEVVSAPPGNDNVDDVPAETAPHSKSDVKAFRAQLKQTLKDLPTTQALRAKEGQDFHHTPSEVLDGGSLIGKVTEQLIAHPEWLPEALTFYRACARRDSLLSSLRAVCLRSLWDASEKFGKETASKEEYPANIRFIAESLPPTSWNN